MKTIIIFFAVMMLMVSCKKEINDTAPVAQQKIPDAMLENPTMDAARRKNTGHGNPHDNPPPPPIVNGSGCLLIDFDGQLVTDPNWNGGITFTCAPANLNSDQQTFILNRVKQDYLQFTSLTITTEESLYNTFPENKRMRCIVTESWQWYGYYGGVAYVNSYLWYGVKQCFVFSPLLGNDKNRSDATSHECGHTLGLRHQSVYDENCNKVSEYNAGDGVYAPIMGNSYSSIQKWWIGPSSAGCNVIQNDTLIISNTIKQ